MMRAYCIRFLIAAALIFFGAGAINLIADPYNIWGTPLINGVNTQKYSVFHERIESYAGWANWQPPPQTILLGTSKTADGLRPDHPVFRKDTTYSMALGGEPIHESLILFKHALKAGKLRRVVIGLDFFAFNTYWAADFAGQEKRLTPGSNLDLLFNTSTLSDSITTIRQSMPPLTLISAAQGADNEPPRFSPPANIMPMRLLFTEVEKIYVTYHRPFPYHIYSYTNPASGDDTLVYLRELLHLAYANDIEVRMLISPSHAWHWEGLANIGLWGKWEQWKHEMVKINREESDQAGKTAYSLWDFSGYNSITTEAVPAAGSPDKMRWYSDSSHYNRACGDLILDRIFGHHDPARLIPQDFGTLIDERTIDAHLSDIREARAQYSETHPADVQEMAALSKQFWNP